MSNFPPTGAAVIAQSLHSLGIRTVFGLVGVPIGEVGEACMAAGIRFIGMRNEQSASYAASVHGYLTGAPGVCLVVGGPGVVHALAGVSNASENNWPLLLLAGSSERYLVGKGAFQEMDHVGLLGARELGVKLATRPGCVEEIPGCVRNAYRAAWYGRPGVGFVDLPADLIQENLEEEEMEALKNRVVPAPPRSEGDSRRVKRAAELLRGANNPLVIFGKGAAYGRAELAIRELVGRTGIPFLPSPMGKGVVPDSHPLNISSARSAALKNADVVLVLGARLNWMFAFGSVPKWSPTAKIIQVDLAAEEVGRNQGDPELSILGDINLVVPQLLAELHNFKYAGQFVKQLEASKLKNEAQIQTLESKTGLPLSYLQAYKVIRSTIDSLSPPDESRVVLVSEGSNTMDISRTAFPIQSPRQRLDAGSNGTMGAGLGYAIAAHDVYNANVSASQRKKIVCLEGDSAIGFSAMEIETMARNKMDVLIYVINNGGIYSGVADSSEEYAQKQASTLEGKWDLLGSLRSSSLTYAVRYEKLAEACGGLGFFVNTPEELREATVAGFKSDKVVVINVIIESGKDAIPNFGWNAAPKPKRKAKM
ncbi:thiamine pyrophosphate-requiring enzyme [Eremomyces bilateralis CBS 781.70]|uniref:2-hydroxyacyl-CoA lyase n=1 Tax=Eremomyces bilateralis CBS 781.70 TaxID=1392243 RepID=A0A6G1G0A7_9PEZI|nr:thiamine pyrophosphate-requiring enzyme [Eremomyces bilateralis CBS 781.70]KAF1811249.1 thiamine pyrophosphate-requiring enzyme [Eremomyces bilateralis CBS 781.70]